MQPATGKYSQYDQRENLHATIPFNQEETNKIKANAGGVGCLILESYLEKTESGGYRITKHFETLAQRIQLTYKIPFGEQEAFGNEISIGDSTAFLIDKRHALTAAHVVCKRGTDDLDFYKIYSLHLVFGYQMDQSNQCNVEFNKNAVYKIKKVVSHKYIRDKLKKFHWSDWALLKLDREAEGPMPLNVNLGSTQNYRRGDNVYMLGHPNGLPLKLTHGSFMRNSCNMGDNSFQVSIDSFYGNSGSPLFDTNTHEVIGILSQGNKDFEVDPNYRGTGQNRIKVAHIDKRTIELYGYEKCQKIETLDFTKFLQEGCVLSSAVLAHELQPFLLAALSFSKAFLEFMDSFEDKTIAFHS